jgi:hypothetical protein
MFCHIAENRRGRPLLSREVIVDLIGNTRIEAELDTNSHPNGVEVATCFTDHRDPDLIEHPLVDLIAQRVYGLALGYEDINDHDDLRRDPLLAAVVGKLNPRGTTRRRARDRGKPLAGKSTINRLELTPVGADADSRYKKVTCHTH